MKKPQEFDNLQDQQLINLLTSGAVGVIPTDTVYGLVCAANNKEAVARLYKLKDREHKPGTVIAASIEQLVELGIKKKYLQAVEQFWPNSISIEIPHSLEYLHQGTSRQAFRIPKNAKHLQFLEKTGPLQTSSANHPGEPTATTIEEAKHVFEDLVDFYVDGGDLAANLPSTIIRVVDDAVDVIREGAVKINEKGEIET